ncbi:MAG: cupin domain-containing protein [Gammaproteobacteria bacterium]|jgi:transcriptional regulator with XRE-family HTH domain|nr:cupin domain-containing protein [Gammaproteobacteria bacterium]MBT5216145.1 cupin domain-containing protein [Gammaproteobacteria bacterium]MBT5542247.1 cupin domain-containing protein [Gammaproteobacteria bacterium]MBT6073457.1 cupin domain-containing protein [Gammaproteobacteria bacterium]MBT7753704.1 cupin domain-containing protein [Gammaproteobacteria bacterium]
MPEKDIDIGNRLKILRDERNISQRQLAKKSNVSNAAISLIENNKTNPSLGMLKKILDAVPISISDFFAMDILEENKVVFRKDELVEIGSGLISYLQVGQNLKNNQPQMILERYKPGADTGKNMLTHESEESGLILEGRMELTVGDQTYFLGVGDAYLFNSSIPHRFKNTGGIDCVIVSACTPPSF